MKNSTEHRTHLHRLVAGHLLSGVIFAGAMYAGLVSAAGEVTSIQTTDQPGTPTQYTLDGRTFSWGMGQNQVMEGFTSQSQNFSFAGTADRVEIIRHDVNNVSSGNPCGVFVEKLGVSSEVLKANYPSDGSDIGNCDMAAMLASRVVNRGALNLFSNIGPNPKNVERVDYLYDHGVLAPLTTSALALSGHVVAEKSGNNPLQIAAITEVDIFGQPVAYGPLVLVDRNGCSGETICYGITNLRHNYAFFQNNSTSPQGYPSFLKDSTESVGMAFVSLDKLGVAAGQVYYGYSYFGDDVDASIHTLTDVTTFPQDTDDEEIVFGDGPDIYGGVAGYFLGDSLSVVTGAVFKDENGDGQLDENEAGIAEVGLSVHQDTNGNGVFDPNIDSQLGPSFNTDINGEFRVPGLGDGVYFLLLNEDDDDLPPAISLVPGTNPVMVVINGNDADGINFGFISDTGPTDGGSTTGGSDAGNTDSGNSDAGVDAGNTDAGVDAGNTDAGVDAGNTDAGVDAGNTDAGVDAGNTDAGVDAGNTDAGVDAGNTDAGVDAGNTAAGNTDAGVDAGNTDAGVDAGNTDAGVDAGNTDAGVDAGNTDAGVDAGNTDAGVDAGNTDAGNTDSGGTDAGTGTTDSGTDGEFIIINDGDNETTANLDKASVAQGSFVEIDVLANDDDSAGQGLMINSTSQSPNAKIVIDNSDIDNPFIVYTPEFGFIGKDTFLYIIEDGAGALSTGTVEVDVLRFSDINDNGINDFEECDCDNLTIEVGVKGVALGASSAIAFLFLTLVFGLRRYVRTGRRESVRC